MKYEMAYYNTYGGIVDGVPNTIAFTADIDCDESTPDSIKKRLAFLWIVENKHSLKIIGRKGPLKESDLRHLDLSGADLSDLNLENMDLSYSNLSGANLTNTILHGAELPGVNFSRAKFKNTDMGHVDAHGSDFTDAEFEKTSFRFANLESTQLSHLKWNAEL